MLFLVIFICTLTRWIAYMNFNVFSGVSKKNNKSLKFCIFFSRSASIYTEVTSDY
jgi:hypothetical protein